MKDGKREAGYMVWDIAVYDRHRCQGVYCFSNGITDQFLVFVELGWEEQEWEGKQRCQGLLTRQRANELGGVGVWECGGGVRCIDVIGAQGSKEGKTWLSIPRLWKWCNQGPIDVGRVW